MDRRFDAAASIEGASLPIFIDGGYRQVRSPKSLESFDPGIRRTWYRMVFRADGLRRRHQDEIFGPAAGVLGLGDEEEPIGLADDDTSHGPASGIRTRDIDRALRFARRVDAGTARVDTCRTPSMTSPADGFEDSGCGKHSGFEAIHGYSYLDRVIIDHSGTTPDPLVMRLGDAADGSDN